ncbi:hypothetical protein FUT84_05515 [Treponema phagedenis]|nr:hypothetical protein FUT84_05515 [Treponema phagedenis]QEK07818.1 hypothetical protein FUT80_02435 [Treponema phagedenis]TYT79980.1 hypothetical protein FS559_10740 [Treponema phagedenis]
MPRKSKLRTGTDARGFKQKRVLKQDRLQSFKTRRFGFDMDVKTKPLDSFFIKCRNYFRAGSKR